MFGGTDYAWKILLVAAVIGVTFGLWQLGEIAWWLITHVKVVW